MLGSKTTFRLIPDDPIDEEKKDRFEHGVFVNWLLSALEASDKSINIGLFGRWGTGKTGILRIFAKKLKSRYPEEYRYCYIDCWRISPDHIRQQLLIEINNVLGGLDANELLDRLYHTTEKQDPADGNKLVRSARELAKSLFIPSVFAAAIITALVIIDRVLPEIDLLSIFGPVLLAPFITQLAVKLSKTNDRALRTVTKVIPPVTSHAEFEKIFKDIISDPPDKKIIIALDNLDRCDGDVAIEILSLVKSFMERKHVFFIIPCDSDAIIRYLRTKANFADYDTAADFLRKFFQASVTIPPLVSSLMIDYVDELVRQYDIPVNEDAKYVISIALMDNPRRIKQFLNHYIANYHLAVELERRPLQQGTITDNAGFLTKILVLRDKFHEFYEGLIKEENLLDYVEKYFINGDIPNYNKEKLDSIIKTDELKEFLKRTRRIRTDDIKPFIKLAQDPHERTLAYVEVRDKIRTNDYAGLNEIIKSSPTRLNEFLQIIKDTISDDFRKGRVQFEANGLDVVLHIHKTVPDSHKSELVEFFGEHAISENILNEINSYDPEIVFSFIDEMEDPDNKNAILERYCDIAFKSANYDMLSKLLAGRVPLLSDKAKGLFKVRISEFYLEEEGLAIPVIRKCITGENIEELLDDKIIKLIISKMTVQVSDENQDRIDTYLQIKQVANEQSKFDFIRRLLGAVLSESEPPQLDDKIDYVLKTLERMDCDDITEDGMSIIYDTMLKYEDETSDEDRQARMLEPILKHFDKLSDNRRTAFIGDKLQNYLDRSDDYLTRMLSAMDPSRVASLNDDRIFEVMFNVASSNANPIILEYMIRNTTGDQRDMIFNLINSHIEDPDGLTLQQIRSLIEKIDQNSKEADRFVPSIIKVLNDSYDYGSAETLDLLAAIFTKCSSAQDAIVQEFVEYAKASQDYVNDAINCLNIVWPHFSDSQKSFVWNKMVNAVNENVDNIGQILDMLVDRKKITQDNYRSIAEALMNLIGQEDRIVLKYMIKIKKMVRLDKDIIKRIAKIPEDHDEISELKKQFMS